MKFNSSVAQCVMTILIGLLLISSSIYKPSIAFQLVMIICGVISMTGLCIVSAIKESKL